jgi:DNA-binding Xre family transcriptional regulator
LDRSFRNRNRSKNCIPGWTGSSAENLPRRSRPWASGINGWEDGYLRISYKPLWKLLIDKDLKKKDLCELAGISPASVTKMGKGGHVTTEVLAKICTALECSLDDIMEIVVDREK